MEFIFAVVENNVYEQINKVGGLMKDFKQRVNGFVVLLRSF
jgi:hypothetical protein